MKYLVVVGMLAATAGIASAQTTPTISQLLEQGFEVVGTQIFPPKLEIFLKKESVLVICEAAGAPLVKTQHCFKIE